MLRYKNSKLIFSSFFWFHFRERKIFILLSIEVPIQAQNNHKQEIALDVFDFFCGQYLKIENKSNNKEKFSKNAVRFNFKYIFVLLFSKA